MFVRRPLRDEEPPRRILDYSADNGNDGARVQRLENGDSGVSLQLFPQPAGSRNVKAFLKVILLVVLAIIAVKLLPLTFALGCVLALAVLALVAVGVSVMAALLAAIVVLAIASSPIWIPVLAIVGLVTLLKRGHGNGRPAGA
jgi:hypothetical protein